MMTLNECRIQELEQENKELKELTEIIHKRFDRWNRTPLNLDIARKINQLIMIMTEIKPMSDLLLKSVEECKNTRGWDLIPHTLHFNLELLFSECELAARKLSNSTPNATIRELIEKAYMQGQSDEGIDPSYSNAKLCANKLLEGDNNG